MKKNLTIFILIQFLFISNINFAQSFQYVFPKPESILNSKSTNIILRNSDKIDESSLSDNLLSVTGSKSGSNYGEFLLSDDEKTLVFNPGSSFYGDEIVTVVLRSGIKTQTGKVLEGYSFRFTTEPQALQKKAARYFDDEEERKLFESSYSTNNSNNSLPAPEITIDSVNNPYLGTIFLATWDRNVPAKYGNFIFMLDNNGNILDSTRVTGAPYDFKVQPNGQLSYALGDFAGNVPGEGEALRYLVLDENLAVVDSFSIKNGYPTDFHEFHLLPNGHGMLMSYYNVTFDMSKIVEGGRTDATLVINIIQEQDKDKNVVFEWRNIDHIPITDSDLDLTGPRVNYGTLNAFVVDNDDNILGSFRNHSQIMKISRTTGEVMWRSGGTKGEFTYINEHEENAPFYHARQHNIIRLSNGNISLFDNGEFHSPSYSRAVEYALDEENKTMTLVSEFRYPNGNIVAAAAGNATRYDDGGWFVGYGILHPLSEVKRNIVEVRADGSISFELSLPKNVIAYRVSKELWKEQVTIPTVVKFEVLQGNTYSFHDNNVDTGVDIKYIALDGFSYNEATVSRLPYGPTNPVFDGNTPTIYPVSVKYEGAAISQQTTEFHFDLSIFTQIKNPSSTSIYWRATSGQGLFTKISTTYNSNNNELVATTSGLGEIAFGMPFVDDVANIPIPVEPVNSEKIILQDQILVRWTGSGTYDSFNIQVSAVNDFSTLVINESTSESFVNAEGLTNSTTYYWRVSTTLDGNTSAWSEVWSFNITDAFIEVLSPIGGDSFSIGDSKIIRWDTNIIDSVEVDLFKNEMKIMSLGNTKGSNQAIQWNISSEVEVGDSYKVRVRSLADSSVFAISDTAFSIMPAVSVDENEIINEFSLSQNYPNPFNPSTKIEFQIPKQGGFIELKVYNILGVEVGKLVNGYKSSGFYSVTFDASNLPSGVYIYRLQSDGLTLSTKKMLLLK